MIQDKRAYIFFLCAGFACIVFSACHPVSSVKDAAFKVLNDQATGLHFSNKLTNTTQFNLLNYMYFYNGGGVGAGDFNNDGLMDVFFAANQGKNKLFINKGGLHFDDATDVAGIPQDSSWSTGVSLSDINNDGLLDIYICRVGKLEGLPPGHNQLLICKGIDKNGMPSYEDKSHEYGLDFSGFSTQAVFFDYDKDGDLDMYLLNHTIHNNGNYGERQLLLKIQSPVSGDRIYRNDNNHFTDVTAQTGIHSSVIGYGLGVVVADINMDGYPDIYVGNDFHENDYLYINQHNGTFKDGTSAELMHTSQFSMGVDAADANNDGYPEIISMDMLPNDPYILKRSLGADDYDIFYSKIGYGYNYQYSRNNLQYNRKNGLFSEIGLYAGVAATDWSWAPLWMDFDNDGKKDLFVSNGIPKRMNDIDYINFISNGELKDPKSTSADQKDMALIDKLPQIKIPNRFFHNKGDFNFDDIADKVDGDMPTYSNGAVYADFDNDGDLDIIVNNIDEPVLLYQNKTNDITKKSFLEIKLKGPASNLNATGAKVMLYAGAEIRTYEKYPVRGFLSSMETPLHIGLDHTSADSILLIWPDNTYQHVETTKEQPFISLEYRKGLPAFDYSYIGNNAKGNPAKLSNITTEVNLRFLHKENSFHEFDRESLLPHMLSAEGPALATGDFNNDRREDIFIGSARSEKSAIFQQLASGKFVRLNEPSLEADSSYEDTGACWADVNNDGFTDLIVASGGNEFFGTDSNLTPRVYLNDGQSHFTKLAHAFNNLFLNASCVTASDFNKDGFVDLFIGGRSVPWEYGQTPHSYLLQNNGKGSFTDVTQKYAPQLSLIGMVTDAQWFDLNKDGVKDLIVCLEWGGVYAFTNNNSVFTEHVLTDKKGWWNFVLPVDINNDGNIDLIAGNLGMNSRLKASAKEPVKLYYSDFDDNGKKEQVLTYFLNGREIPFASKAELEKQMPVMKKRFLYARDFANADLENLFAKDKLKAAVVLTADYFSNAVLINKGDFKFETQAMPWQAQLSTYKTAAVINVNHDSLPDIFLGGNFYENNIAMGRYDGDFGTVLLNKGNGLLFAQNADGFQVKGQVRHAKNISIAGHEALIIARNNDSTLVVRFADK